MKVRAIARMSVYRLRSTWHDRWTGLLTLAVVIGLLGGVSMTAIAGARRTQSSFPTYLASIHPSDLQAFVTYAGLTPEPYSPQLLVAIRRLPYVQHQTTVIGFDPNIATVQVQRPLPVPKLSAQAPPAIEGSPDGEFLTQDRLSVIEGRMFDPSTDNEILMSSGAASSAGMRLGSVVKIGFYSNQQQESPTFVGFPADPPFYTANLRLVGIIKSPDQIVESDDDALGNQEAVLTPALTKRLLLCCAAYSYVNLELTGGTRHSAAVTAGLKRVDPLFSQVSEIQSYGPLVSTTELSIRPEAVAFGLFGALAAIGSIVISGLIVGRLVRRNGRDSDVLRSLGANRAAVAVENLVGVTVAIILGAAFAVAVAFALSPLGPVGPVRPLLGRPTPEFDTTVLVGGCALLVFALTLYACVAAFRMTPRHQAKVRRGLPQPSKVVQATFASGLPISALLGLRATIGSNTERDEAPVRSALGGSVAAVIIVVASIIFGSSLNSLVSQPALYGWNWNYALLSGFAAQEDLPAGITANLMNHDRLVAGWSGVSFGRVTVDSQPVPAMVTDPGSSVAPPLLSGHALDSPSQIVLGPATAARLHTRVGATVVASTGRGHSLPLKVVGISTLPTLGGNGAHGLSMGTGAIVARSLFTNQQLNLQQNSTPGPNAILVSIRRGVKPASAFASLEAVAESINQQDSERPAGGVVSVLRPAEITNYRTLGSTPATLAAVLAAGALLALDLTLVSSVRRRRRTFAVLKALGLTRRQIRMTVSWQASVAAGVGVVVGIPSGIALGRWLWDLFARSIYAVPDPSVPGVTVVLIAVGALVFANVMASVPGRVAAGTTTAELLRSE